jgi:hypothetical protein
VMVVITSHCNYRVCPHSVLSEMLERLGQAMSEVGKTILTALVTTIVGAVLALGFAFLTNGGVVQLLGGISVSQLSSGTTFQSDAKCGEHREAIMTTAKNSFCFLTDVSVRPGSATNKGLWDVCRIEVAGGQFVLTTEMLRTCNKPEEQPEISCKARCFVF